MSLLSRANSPIWIATALVAAAIVVLAPNTYWLYLLGLTAVYVIVGTGLNVLIGLSGQVSIGHAGFFAVGAYVAAILTTRFGMSFWLTLPLCMLIPAVLSALLAAPALRVKGPYLAMVTIAFGLVLQNVLIESEPLTGGFNGISNIDKPMLAGMPLSLRAHVGVMVAGFLYGLIEATIAASMPAAYREIIGFGLVIVVLAIKPEGLFGRPAIRKV